VSTGPRTLGGSVLAGMLALGCPRGPDPRPPEDTSGRSTEPEPPAAAPTCGDASTVLIDPARSVPTAATMAAILALDDPALADALEVLSEHARDRPSALPVRSAFSIAQWSWEVPLVRDTFARAGFVAGQLGAVHTDELPPLWILPLGCALEAAIAKLHEHDELELRDLGDIAIASPRAGSSFPFDMIVRADAIALAPAGRAREALAVWRRQPTGTGAPVVAPGAVLAEVARAPIRMLVRASGLLRPDAPHTTALERRFRVTAAGVIALDASDP